MFEHVTAHQLLLNDSPHEYYYRLDLCKLADVMKLTNCPGIHWAVGVCYPPLGS